MTCEEIHTLLSPYADGELDLVRSMEIDKHVEQCSACATALTRIQSLSSALGDPKLYYEAPAHLHQRIRASIKSSSGPRRSHVWRPILATAAAAAVLFIGGWGAMRALSGSSTDERLAREVVSSHVRSLLWDKHRVDVESSDRHTVKPWFVGKVDVAPEVKDLAPQGFPLVGGRLDYVDDRSAAALVYQREKHIINVFVWRTAAQDRGPEAMDRQGYHLIHWIDNGRMFWVVSDLNARELGEFAELVRHAE